MEKFMTADEALAYFEDLNSSFSSFDGDSDDERFGTNATLVLQPPVEKPEAITDEDSDVDDTEDANHLPRRILVAEASFAKRRLTRNHSTTDQAEAESPRLKVLFIYYY